MSQVLDSLSGVVCILVYNATEHEHDSWLTAVLQRLQDAGVTLKLNADKCQFSEECVTFLGHVVDRHGVHADPEKIRAISEMPVLCKDQSWQWRAEEEHAFNDVKRLLVAPGVL